MKALLTRCALEAGQLLRGHFGRVRGIRIKDSRCSIVTEADLASERLILRHLRKHHPDHNVIAEESGHRDRGAEFTWVVDPLDGTSNFAAGIPWFGVMLAVLKNGRPFLGALYLPIDDVLYLAEADQGATRNGRPVHVTTETRFAHVLVGYGMDSSPSDATARRQARTLGRLVQQVRNVRSTNSLVDFALTMDGRLGACVNYHTKIWDIAAPAVLFPETGARFTDLGGRPIALDLGPGACARSYAIAAGNPALHTAVLKALAPR